MKLTLGFSTCPNDTFIFEAIVHGRIDTEGLTFEVNMADVEELNRKAFRGEPDITKISYHAYAYLADYYLLLEAGSALGFKNGPLLIGKTTDLTGLSDQIKLAIPGKYTTANLLLSIAYPKFQNKKEYLFSDIEQAILSGEVDAGVIIHENRFTYQEKGLKKVMDLGEYWEKETQLAIPLGGIIVNRRLPLEIQQKVNRIMRRSVQYAMDQPTISYPFVRQHAQEMEPDVMRKHIHLYVNEFTRDLGKEGKKAIETLYQKAIERGVISDLRKDIFVNP